VIKEKFPLYAQDQAMLHVHIIKLEPDLNCLPEDTIHISDFGADNFKCL
jgi:hypothetical protein